VDTQTFPEPEDMDEPLEENTQVCGRESQQHGCVPAPS